MKASRWRVRTLLGLVVVVALGVKGVLLVDKWGNGAARRRLALEQLVSTFPRPASAELTLVAALDDWDAGVRYTALCALDWIGSTSPALVDPLVALLEVETEAPRHNTVAYSPPPPIRRPADSLKRIKAPAAVLAPRLRAAMASPHKWLRLQATEVLCDAAGRPSPPAPDLAPLLLKALRDQDAAIRMWVPEALARLDADARRKAVAILVDQLRQPDRPTQFLATVGLARFDPEAGAAVAVLTDRLRAARSSKPPTPARSEPAASSDVPALSLQRITLGKPGQEVGGVLGARLLDLYLLGRLGPIARPAVPEVVRQMTSRDEGGHVLFLLNAFMPGQGASYSIEVERLLEPGEMTQLTSRVCPLGAVVLGRIGPEAERQAVDILVGMLRAEDEPQRPGAVDALGALGPKASAAIPLLLGFAEGKVPAWPGEDEWQAPARLMRALEQVCKGDDPRLVAALIRMLKSSDPTKRLGATMILGGINPPAPAAVPLLIEALNDEVQGVRGVSALALGRYDGSERKAAVLALLGALDDEDEHVRSDALKSLARDRAGADRVIPTALRLLRSKNPSLRSAAAKVLGAYGSAAGPAVPALREARRDPMSYVRDAAEKALAAIAPSEAANPVE